MGYVVLNRRITRVLFLFMIAIFFLFLRLGWIQVVRGEELRQMALNNRLQKVVVEAKRGLILDRNGKALAISVGVPSIGVYPPQIRHSDSAEETAAQLAAILGLEKDEVLNKITQNKGFVWVKRKVAPEIGDKIEEKDLKGVQVIEESERFYPNQTLAAHLLGIAGLDNQGLEGLEKAYEQELRGTPGSLLAEFDATGRPIPAATHEYFPPQDGNSLVLTIDETIQFMVERELDRIMVDNKPQGASIVVMDPRSGEVLAMSSRPNFNPNYPDYLSSPVSTRRNQSLTDAYEPGSTFKIITTSAALEEGLVRSNETFYDPGYIKVGDRTIKCWRYPRAHGSQTFAEGVQNSCNPVFVTLGLRLYEKNPQLFYDYIKGFGFGSRTGILSTQEGGGIIVPQASLTPNYVASIAIGQSIAVTPIQITTAVSAVANGGVLIKPHLVKEIRDRDGKTIETIKPEPVRQVISKETSAQVLQLLEGVVSEGTGNGAYIDGYRVGGKTGTAQKAGKGGYQPGKYVASFIGIAPVDDPRLVALVVIDEPSGYPYYGGTIAAPVFQRLVGDVLRYMGVKPKYSQEEKPAAETASPVTNVVVPEATGLDQKEAEKVFTLAGLQTVFAGQGETVIEQKPDGLKRVPKGSKVTLTLGDRSPGTKISIPDLTGLRTWQAAELLEAMGLRLYAIGSGQVREQRPEPGKLVDRETAVTASFSEGEPTDQGP